MTVQTALQQGARLLQDDAAIAVPRLTAEVLLAHALHRQREYLFGHPEHELSELEWLHYGRYLHERLQGKPTQYITGRQEFYGREFQVTADVLIPRPETEHVVETALRLARGASRISRILDVGCGSGNLAVIVSNPPYVPLGEAAGLQREVRDWEPRQALFAGPTGFEIYERLVRDAGRVLRAGGWLIMELGFNSREGVAALFSNGWQEIDWVPDLAGIPRVVAARQAMPGL